MNRPGGRGTLPADLFPAGETSAAIRAQPDEKRGWGGGRNPLVSLVGAPGGRRVAPGLKERKRERPTSWRSKSFGGKCAAGYCHATLSSPARIRASYRRPFL